MEHGKSKFEVISLIIVSPIDFLKKFFFEKGILKKEFENSCNMSQMANFSEQAVVDELVI